MRPLTVILAFPDNAPAHRVMQILREAGKQPSIVKPTLTIVSGEQADAEGLAQQLRRVGVSVQIHESLAPAGDGSPVAANPSARPVVLHGTDNLPAHVEINGDSYPLGDIVRKAHALSGMSAEAWNRLPQHTRDDYIETALEAIRTQDPTAPQHEITADEFAAAFEAKQKEVADRNAAEALSAQANAEHADVLGEQEKGDQPDPARNQAGTAEQAGDIAPGHHWEQRPDGTKTLRADDGGAADDGQATTDGSASE